MARPDQNPIPPLVRKRSYAAAFSYVGSARRISAWVKRLRANIAAVIAAWVGAVLLILLAWALVTVWYVLIFGVFGLFVFPFRLIRRGQRKRQHVSEAQLATMQAMMTQQQAMMTQQQAMMTQQQQPAPLPPPAEPSAPAIPAPPPESQHE